eukprot:gb/GFBE01067762.1/.p1 GENE.gb/GFBE01067762.1/~~gb/GFBE01067762.1/.p1  ORF type:complete len:1255 (+),score=364.10 gb/GFBE01067762.1/:1-3765(+)
MSTQLKDVLDAFRRHDVAAGGQGKMTVQQLCEVIKSLDPVRWTDAVVEEILGAAKAEKVFEGDHVPFEDLLQWLAGNAPSGDGDQAFMNKFSRQNAALGAEVTMKMTKMKALIVGCSGVAAEIAKNLVLQGLGGVTLVDPKSARIEDLGTNFFLSEADVGKPLGSTLVPRFKELNPFCDIKSADAISPELVAQHAVVLVCESMPLPELVKWNDFCRLQTPKPIAFLYVHTGGMFGNVFVDFGPAHVVHDDNGQRPMVRLVESIETGPEALVRLTVPDGQAPGSLPEGGYIEFADVKGCDGILTHEEASPCGDMVKAWKISSKPGDPINTIRIGDTSAFPPYVSGGMVTEKKVGKPYKFRSFAEALKNPGMPFDDLVGTDMINFGSELQTHLLLHAVLSLEAERGAAVGAADLAAVAAKAKELMASKDSEIDVDIDDEFATKYLRHFHTPLQPLCAFLGGIVAQEVVKIAGKFTPIPGWLHFNAVEALPKEQPSDCAPTGSRYDSLASVYGHAFVKKLGDLKYFMVGCGALGCEFLKNFALNGVCCGENGLLTVTDADRIELSNLTRQFLFREHNVGQPKSKAASAMAQVMNPGMKVRALEMFVGSKTEDHFNDAFWMGLDGVCNALDNMEARFYVDDQCVKYEKSLLESGTMGPAGNVDPIVPFKTQTYRDGGQADEGGGIPMCTLRNFPHLPDHCIEWARDQFELFFVKSAKQLKKFYEDPATFIDEMGSSTDMTQSIFEVRGLLSLLSAAENPSIKSAGQLAFDFFHFVFRDKIMDLVAAFPEDARVIDPETKQDKGPFWSGHKRFPLAATFNVENDTHWRFQVAATALFASMLGVVPPKQEGDDNWCKDFKSKAWVAAQVKDLAAPEYVSGGVNVEGDDAAGHSSKGSDAKAALQGLLERLGGYRDKPVPKLEEADFEKDDDFNFHIEFITVCSNLRADNYHIANSDFNQVKLVAGRIVPAIATTTAAVCGLVMLELFKLVSGCGTEGFRTRQIGLAVNTYTSFEAQEPKTFTSGVEKKVPRAEELPADAFDEAGNMKKEYILEEAYAAYPEKHSVWDKIRIPTGTMTLGGFRDWLASEHKVQLKNWSFVLGWKKVQDDDNKETRVPFSSQIYPPPVAIDATLLPPLEDAQGDAMKKIMGSTAIPQAQKMKYLSEWQNAKKTGKLPVSSGPSITLDMPLKDILALMEVRAEEALKDGTIHPKWGKAISGLADRKFWVIPSDQTPSCSTIVDEGQEPVDIRYMARLEVPLNE